jgi:glutamyl-tRNA synthetase
MPIPELTDRLIGVWQKADYDTAAVSRPWLEQLTTLLAPSLTRLTNAAEQAQVFFTQDLTLGEEALAQLQQANVPEVLTFIAAQLQQTPELTADAAKDLINQAVKQQGVKKGLVMRSLRAALTGEVHGPDLIETWLLLHQRGWDGTRLEKGLAIA